MKLSLYIPGLKWLDEHTAADACAGLTLPALQRLLGRGQRTVYVGEASRLLGDAFGLPALAPASSLAAAAGLPDGEWLVVRPVHLHVERDRAILWDNLTLTAPESTALLSALNTHFAEDGLVFLATENTDQWFVRVPHSLAARFSPLIDAVGGNIDDYRPQNDTGLYWTKLLNEVQMLLFSHPVNQSREAQGLPAVNGLWLWGNGEEAVPMSSAGLVLSDDPLWQHYAQRAAIPYDGAPYDMDACLRMAEGHESVCIHLDQLYAPAQYRQSWPWRNALQEMETRWFVPLLTAIRLRCLHSVQICCHGEPGMCCRIVPSDLWKFWRPDLSLTDLNTH